MAVKGKAQLLRQMRALPEKVRAAAAEALDKGAGDIADAVRNAARGERLKRSVGHGPKAPSTRATGAFRPTGVQLSEAANGAGLKQVVWAGDDDAFWARWEEFGTAPHSVAKGASKKSGKRQDVGPHHPGERPHPFFWPSVRARKRLIKGRMVRAGTKAAKAAAASK